MVSKKRATDLIFSLLFTCIFFTLNQAECYYPDYLVAQDFDFVPCGASNTISACCVPSEGDVCLSNGLCDWTGNYLYRGACTDPSWKSENCTTYCASGMSAQAQQSILSVMA